MKYTFYLLTLLVIYSCKNDSNIPPSLKYMPDTNLLKKGVVAKFYKHQDKSEGGQKKTDIGYRKYFLAGDLLTIEDFNAEFAPSYNAEFYIDSNKWIARRETYIQRRGNPLKYSLTDSVFLDWEGQTAKKSKFLSLNEWKYKTEDFQNFRTDTIFEERPAIIIKGDKYHERRKDAEAVIDTFE